jgi:PTS system mannose-specific IID component
VASPPVRSLAGRDLVRVALRSFLLQALWNPERMQGQGFALALRPVARRLAPPAAEAHWLEGHMGYFNTNPPLAGCALGVVARFECEAAGGPPPALESVKSALGAGLAAVGDSLFWSTLRPLAAVLGIVWYLEGSPAGPLLFLVVYNIFHLYARVRGVVLGTRMGLAVVQTWLSRRLTRLRAVLQILGVFGAASLCHAGLVFLTPAYGRPGWVGLAAGFLVGVLWTERRRLSPSALGLAIFTAALTWATWKG